MTLSSKGLKLITNIITISTFRRNVRNNFDFGKGKYAISYKDLSKRLDQVSAKINCLLASKAPINPLTQDQEESISLLSDLRCHFKVNCKGYPIPLRIRLNSSKGLNFTYLSVSSTIERPDKDHCDKSLLITNKQSCLSYYGKSDKEKCFQERFLFLTLECTREYAANLSITFDNKKIPKNMDRDSESPLLEGHKLDGSVFKREKGPQIQTKFPESKSMIKLIGRQDQSTIKTHRCNVSILKNKLDLEDKSKKLLLSNKKIIGKHYDTILTDKLKQIQNLKKGSIICILYIKLRKLGLELYSRFRAKRKLKQQAEKRLNSGLKIYIAINYMLHKTDKRYKERLYGKLNSYFTA
jgi:hypothetical protein